MKTFRLLLAFTLIVLFFSSCGRVKSDYEPRVEFIEHSYVALKPSDINNNSYKNPRNIFLEIKSLRSDETEMTANWYKKTNGVYQIFALNDTGRKLKETLAYEIVDTVYLNKEIAKYRETHLDEIDLAYQGQTIVLKKIVKRNHLEKYLWTKMEVTSKDSVLKYNSKNKSFLTSATEPTTKLKNDFGPIMVVLMLFILTLSIALKDRIKWLKKLRQAIFKNDFLNFTIKNDHQLNSWLLFLIIFLFTFIYPWWLTGEDSMLWLFVGIVMGLVAKLIFLLDKIKFKELETYNFNVPFSIMLISIIGSFQNISLNGMPEKFCYIASIIIVLPALLDVTLFSIEQNKLKNSQEKKE